MGAVGSLQPLLAPQARYANCHTCHEGLLLTGAPVQDGSGTAEDGELAGGTCTCYVAEPPAAPGSCPCAHISDQSRLLTALPPRHTLTTFPHESLLSRLPHQFVSSVRARPGPWHMGGSAEC